MKVKFGAIVVDGRNKIGGHVMSKNRAGSYMRTKVTPVNPRTTYQEDVRNRLSTISTSWDNLSSDLLSKWNSAVTSWSKTDIFGDIKHPSGFNLYQKLNNNALRVGGVALTAPPFKVILSYLGKLTIGTVTSSAIPLTFDLQALETNEKLEISATPSLPSGKNFVKSEYRIIGHSLTLTTGATDCGALYIAKFGAPAFNGGFFISARIVNSSTGQAGVPVSAYYNGF
jgi:hypothetical protein